MLPRGLAADLLPPGLAARLRAALPAALTAARLLVGACSCDLFLERDPVQHRDEAALRQRYRALQLSRTAIIQAIDRHRRGDHPARPPAVWQAMLSAFVAEHARNAGETLYYHEFSPGGLSGGGLSRPPVPVATGTARNNPGGWLEEDVAVIVSRGS